MAAQQAEEGLIGISLRDNQIRMIETLLGPKEKKVIKVAKGELKVPFNLEAVQNRSSIRVIADDINKLYETSGFEHTQAALSIDSDLVLIKKIPTDTSLEAEELREQIRWEIGQLMINQLESFIIDYETLETKNGSTQEKQVVVVTIRKAVVDYLREIFAATDLHLRAIDVDVFSAQRVLADAYAFAPDQKIALVDIRQRNLQFSIIHHGFYLLLEVNYPTEDGFEVGINKDEQLARMISKELRRIILDNKLGKSVEDMDEIYLYGEDVEDNVIELLSQAHNVNLHRFNPFEKIPLSESLTDTEVTNHPENFVTSVGVAIKGF